MKKIFNFLKGLFKSKSKLSFGPIQKAWLKSLRKNPERQMKNQLGKVDPVNRTYKACCLGEYKVIYNKMKGLPFPVDSTNCIVDGSRKDILFDSYHELGLMDGNGQFYKKEDKSVFFKDVEYQSLAHMNDMGVTWPEIADFVEANPHLVFNKFI